MKIDRGPIEYDGNVFAFVIDHLNSLYQEGFVLPGIHLDRNKNLSHYILYHEGYMSSAKKELIKRLEDACPWDDVEYCIMQYIDDICLRKHFIEEGIQKGYKYELAKEWIAASMLVAYEALDYLDVLRV